MGRLRLLIADARPVRRQRLRSEIVRQDGFEIAGVCGSLMEAYSAVESGAADAVLICESFRALPEYRMFIDLAKLIHVAIVPVADNVETLAPLLAELSRVARNPMVHPRLPARSAYTAARAIVPSGTAPFAAGDPIIVIGASTGGVEALHRVLSAFPADCAPTLVVQHIRGDFSAAFADRLNRACQPQVAEAVDGQPLARGSILVAPGDQQHLEIHGRVPVCRLASTPPVNGHRPSVDALFATAVAYGPQVVAALLTGMGRDGARGLLSIREAGGHTIAQDRESSTVYGMPRVAAELGAAMEILPLESISGAILRAVSQTRNRCAV